MLNGKGNETEAGILARMAMENKMACRILVLFSRKSDQRKLFRGLQNLSGSHFFGMNSRIGS